MTLQEIMHQLLLNGLEITIVVKRHSGPPPRSERPRHTAECEFCGWTGEYDSPQSAARALRSHHNHCPSKNRSMVDQLADDDSDDDEDRTWLQSMSSSRGQSQATTDED